MHLATLKYELNEEFGESKCDLLVRREYTIEVKKDPDLAEYDRLFGSRVAVINAEVRSPLAGLFNRQLDYGPVPVEVFAFFDAGVAWTQADGPDFANGTRPWVKSAGFGARVNLFGFAIGEFNMARPLDRQGRGWMFVFNLRPGF